MIPQHLLKNRYRKSSLTVLAIIIIGLLGLFPLPLNAQWFPPLNAQWFPSLPQIPTYLFFTPFSNPLPFAPGAAPFFPSAGIQGSLAPFLPFPIAAINSEEEVTPIFLGVTTILLDPSVTLLDKVVIKPAGSEPIKLSAIIPPLTIYIYAPPVPVPSPVTTVAPITAVAPVTTSIAIIPPAITTIAPAAISGSLFFKFLPLIL